MNDNRIGFMQGRLSPIINGKIQEFPWGNWKQEFNTASILGFKLMEWTLDQERLYENPLMNEKGQSEISLLCKTFGIKIPSLTGDCFMQSPYWKLFGSEKKNRQNDLIAILKSCEKIGIRYIVIPLVDGGRLDNNTQEQSLLEFLVDIENLISDMGIQIAFESDFEPDRLKFFIEQFSDTIFGINYDIGNSAALGFDVREELKSYGDRVLNVHIKDRVLGGSTVPLGEGDANFSEVFRQFANIGYKGNYILQTARAVNGDHSGTINYYKSMAKEWISTYGS